jgi:probable LLM family oxidoreductase
MAHVSGIELGVDTFGDVTVDDAGSAVPHPQVVRDVVDEGVLADELGLDFFGVGEHHRQDFSVSAPEVVLAAVAARTHRIHLGSAVTVLSSDDPVRVYERFATLDAISGGRAEVMLGRGSFTESFPLFGFALDDYEVLAAEKLELFARLRDEGPVAWEGTTRGPLTGQSVYPTTAGGLRTWVAVGGSPSSIVRAAHYGFPLAVAIIGGAPERFAPHIDLYRRALTELGQEPQPVAVHSPGYVADTDEQAMNELWPHYEVMIGRIGRERGWAPPTRQQFEQEVRHGALHVGSPETVAAKVVQTVQALGIQRFDLKYSAGTLPHSKLMRCLELYGTKVAPLVRDALA